MTDTSPAAIERPAYLIRKYGAYYKPDSRGYTGCTILAGRYTLAEAESITHPNGLDGSRDGMTYIHQDDLRDPSWLAYSALSAERDALLARAETAEAEWDNALNLAAKMATLMQRMDERRLEAIAERDALRAEVERLREALEPFADAMKSARGRMGEMPADSADVTAIACRFITYDHLKDALSEFAQTDAIP